jgi:ABC-type multidrug transport system fused ATPase/permease subunit
MLNNIFIKKIGGASYFLIFLLLVVYLVIQIISAIRDTYCNKIRNIVTSTIYNRVNSHMLYSGKKKIDLGYIKNLFERDLPVMENFIHDCLCDFITNFCVLAISFPVLIYINWRAALGLFTLSIFLMSINYILSNKEQEVNYKIIQVEDDVAKFKLGSLKEWFCIKNFNMQDNYIKNYSELVDTHIQLRNKWLVYWQCTLSYVDIKKTLVSNALIYLVGAIMVKYGLVSIAKLLFFVQIFILWYEALEMLVSITLNIMVNEPSYERVLNSLEKIERDYNKEKRFKTGKIVLDHISFRYSDSRYNILDDISCTFEENMVNVIIGENGTGKSTLMSLIIGQTEPSSGDILFGENCIKELDEDSLHENIAIVSQNCTLFNVSLFNNIKMLNSYITRDEIYELLDKVGLREWALELPDKLDTIVGEGGVNLSGGQCQRISIIQAIVRKVSIILMDEPSSALDVASENMIIKLIEYYKKEKTFIIVTHSQNLIDCADYKFYLKNGRLIREDY